MPGARRARRGIPAATRGLCLLGLALSGAVLPARGLPQEPLAAPQLPWPDEIVAALRSFYERVDVEAVMESVPMPEVAALPQDPDGVAAALAPGLDAPFELVRAIRHATYAGSMLGARGALRAGQGNAIDQALLLAELYRARGLRSA